MLTRGIAPPLLAALLLAAAAAVPSPVPASAQEAPKRTALDAVLKGSITSFDGSHVEVRYDLADASQLEDFADYRPFRVDGSWKRGWFDRSLNLNGTGGVVWKPILRRRVEMEFDARLRIPRDFGGFVAEDRPSEHFTLFSVYDQFFQNKDKRGSPKVHMIARFLPDAPDSGGDYAFRYVNRSPNPALAAQRTFRVRFWREGVDEGLEIEGSRLNGSESQWQALRGFRPGLYVLDSEAWVSNIVVRGDVDPKWAEEAGVDLGLPVRTKPPARVPERDPTPADFAARDRVQQVRNGAEGPAVLVKIIADTAVLEAIRDDAAKAVEESGDVRLVPRMVSLLESQDLATRRLAGRAVAKLTGKSWGFVPDGPEEGRRRAVRSLLDWIEKNPSKFQ